MVAIIVCHAQPILVANIVYLGLSLFGAGAFLWGLGRKIWLNRISAYGMSLNNPPTA
jgi:hypothetical protein